MAVQRQYLDDEKKTTRLSARVQPEIKAKVDCAAKYAGVSTSDYMVQSIVAAANRTIQEHHSVRLSQKDAIEFVNALLTPSEPSQELKDAAKRYLKRSGK